MPQPDSFRKQTIVDSVGRTLSFELDGKGEPVVLLPPGASPAAAWRGVVGHFESACQTYAVNHSGYAQTESFISARPMTLDDEADAVLEILRGVSAPMHLVGHSFGGAVAIRLAIREPERFCSLVLIEPAVYAVLEALGEPELSQEVMTVNRRFVAQVQSGKLAAAFSAYLAYYAGDSGAFAALTANNRERLLALSSTVSAALTAVHMDVTTLADCQAIALPTLLIRGEQTDPMHGILTGRLSEAMPGAQLATVPSAGHLLSLSHPEQTARLIETHWGSVNS